MGCHCKATILIFHSSLVPFLGIMLSNLSSIIMQRHALFWKKTADQEAHKPYSLNVVILGLADQVVLVGKVLPSTLWSQMTSESCGILNSITVHRSMKCPWMVGLLLQNVSRLSTVVSKGAGLQQYLLKYVMFYLTLALSSLFSFQWVNPNLEVSQDADCFGYLWCLL